MADPVGFFVIVAEAYDLDALTTVTRYWSTRGFTSKPGDTPADTHFEEVVMDAGTIRRDMFAAGKTLGQSSISLGTITLANGVQGDGTAQLDGLRRLAFDGRDVSVYYGEGDGLSFPSDFVLVYTGTAEQPVVGRTSVTLRVRGRKANMDVPLRTGSGLYAGDNIPPDGLEGGEDLEGKPKPYLRGRVLNVPCTLVNASKLIYQVNDGAISEVLGVFDRGAPLFTSEVNAEPERTLNLDFATGLDPRGVIWNEGAGRFVVGCRSTPLAGRIGIITSPDGRVWTPRNIGSEDERFAIRLACAPDGNMVAWGDAQDPSTEPTGWYSESGEEWQTSVISTGSVPFGIGTDVAYSLDEDGVFVAMQYDGNDVGGGSGTTWVLRSTDYGATWNAPATVPSTTFPHTRLVEYIPGVGFVGVGADLIALGGYDGDVWTTDPSPWTSLGGSPSGVCYSSRTQELLATVPAPSRRDIWTTQDGVTWTLVTPNIDFTVFSFFECYADATGFYIAGDNEIYFSDDTVNWVKIAEFSEENDSDGSSGSPVFAVARGAIVKVENDFIETIAGGGLVEYASETDLLDDTLAPAPGAVGVWLDGGYIRLGSRPDGDVTASIVQGATEADRYPGAILRELIAASGESVDSAEFDAVDSAAPYELGLYLGTREITFAQAADQIARSVGAYWGEKRDGTFGAGILTEPSGTPVLTITDGDIHGELRPVPIRDGNGVPYGRVQVDYQKNYTVQVEDLAGVTSETRRAFLSQQYRSVEAISAATQTAHLTATDLVLETLIANRTDAETEVARMLALRAALRRRYEFTLMMNAETAAVEFNDVIRLIHPRYGLESGALFRVITLDFQLGAQTVTVGVWG